MMVAGSKTMQFQFRTQVMQSQPGPGGYLTESVTVVGECGIGQIVEHDPDGTAEGRYYTAEAPRYIGHAGASLHYVRLPGDFASRDDAARALFVDFCG